MPRRPTFRGLFALALSLLVHAALAWLLARNGAPHPEKNAAPCESFRVALVYAGPTLLDRDPQVLPAAASGREASEIPSGARGSWLVARGSENEQLVARGSWLVVRTTKHEARSTNHESPSGSGNEARSTNHDPGLFAGAAQARSVVFVIDRSMSMGLHDALTVARRELNAILERLPEHVRFQVIAYNRTAELLAPGLDLVAATAQNKRHTGARLGALGAEGGTSHLPALHRALALAPEAIYFLTDADDLSAREQQAVTQHNRGRCRIHVVELNASRRDRPCPALQELARTNRGTYRAIDPSAYRD